MTRVYDRLGRQLLASCGLVVVGALSAMTFSEDLHLWSGYGSGDQIITVIGGVVAGACWLTASRLPFIRIVASSEDVRVVSYLRSRTVAWTEVVRVEPPPVYGVLGAGIRFVLTDGSVVADDAFARAPVESSRDTARTVRELEEFRRAAWVRHGLLEDGSAQNDHEAGHDG